MKETRMCISCRKRFLKMDLNRIVANEMGHAILDIKQTYNSRGVYICKSKECIEKLQKMKSVEKILKINVTKEEFLKVIGELGENIH